MPFPVAERLVPTHQEPAIGGAKIKRRVRVANDGNAVRTPPSPSVSSCRESRTVRPRTSQARDPIWPSPELRPFRQISPRARRLLARAFPLLSWGAVDVLRNRWSEYPPRYSDIVRQAKAAIPPDSVRWRIRNGDVLFSELVASVMLAGGGVHLLLFHSVHLGVAEIDVRCPRPQLVERWSKCIAAAVAVLPARRRPASSVLEDVARLQIDLTTATLADCLWKIGLGVAVGPVES